ncbi:hypothetical protein DERF_002676 [Dermatophagoides farinae]|uniref:Uncharacterized protein n=1 Tax=Dermatophagoides farinae TaxID=6954 RepID=A0A922LDD5_DERFA|nr:hypothetical protein DERF_002676 [Dermatophagoides farinae]
MVILIRWFYHPKFCFEYCWFVVVTCWIFKLFYRLVHIVVSIPVILNTHITDSSQFYAEYYTRIFHLVRRDFDVVAVDGTHDWP